MYSKCIHSVSNFEPKRLTWILQEKKRKIVMCITKLGENISIIPSLSISSHFSRFCLFSLPFFLNKIWISRHVLRMWYFWYIYHTLSNTSCILPIKTEPDVSTVFKTFFFSYWTRDTRITSDFQSFQSLRIYFSKFQKDWRLDRRKKLLTCWFSLDFTCFVHR